MLPTTEAGDFAELTLLHLRRLSNKNRVKNSLAFLSDFLALASGLLFLGFPKAKCEVGSLLLNEVLLGGFPSMFNINHTRRTSLQ
jgi:hypothetical protein